jgi:hypothetical protein
MSARPLLLLDVDGCFATARPPGDGTGEDACETRFVNGYWLSVRHTLLAAVPELDATFEVRWLSTWRAETEDISDAFGLPHWPYVDFPEQEFGESSITRKFPVAAEFIAAARDQGRRCVWTDDELGEEHHEWARRLVGPSLLLVQTDEREGLRPDLVEKMLDFAAREPRSWPPPTDTLSGSHAPFLYGGEDVA